MTFAPARRYTTDSTNLGFGAIGGLLEHDDGFIYGPSRTTTILG